MPNQPPLRVLFVCLGNICRSPVAEAIFVHLAAERGLSGRFGADSAATSGHTAGQLPDVRMRRLAAAYHLPLHHRARQATAADLRHFDLVVAMDNANVTDLRRLPGAATHADKIVRMRHYDPTPGNGQVPDPYYGGPTEFEAVYQMLLRSCQGLIDALTTAPEPARP